MSMREGEGVERVNVLESDKGRDVSSQIFFF